MKTKESNKFSVSDKYPTKSLLEEIGRETDWKFLNSRASSRIGSNPLIQKNIAFLRNYSNLFGKRLPNNTSGDSFFRKSLRDYSGSLDIIKELRLKETKKPIKQRFRFTEHHHCQWENNQQPAADLETPVAAAAAASGDPQKDNKFLTEIFVKKLEYNFETVTEDEEELLSAEVVESEEEVNVQELVKMAEDFGAENLAEEVPQATDEEGEDELNEVEKMIQQASDELRQVAEEKEQIMDYLAEDQGGEPEAVVEEPPGDGSVFKFDSTIDSAVLRELEEAEKQAKATATVIADLKMRVAELLQKEKMSESEAKELEEKNKSLKQQMLLFEEKTKRIQCLLAQTNLFDKMVPIQPPLQTKHTEDVLPKMLVCGIAEDFMPKIVLCQQRKGDNSTSRDGTRESRKRHENFPPKCKSVVLQDNRSKFQSNQNAECLQNQLLCLQNDMRMMYQENIKQNENVQNCANPSCPKNSRPNSPARRGSCGPGHGLCPADVENRLKEYSDTTDQLEKQLIDVETEVKDIQKELLEVQREREHLEHHRKMFAIQQSCLPPPCYPTPCGHSTCPVKLPPCISGDSGKTNGDDLQYKELKEKYSRLQEDFKAKLTEVAGLRADNEKLRELAEKAEENRSKLELKVKELEKKLKDLRGDAGDKGVGSKEQLIDMMQQLKVHKELYRQAQDELEELRALVEDLQGQLNDYRNKYLEAIQTVEEQSRQIDMMRMENNRISEQVNMEILRVKNQFQEKLQELAPLPDILKATQTKLQEAQQMHLLAERNNEALARELETHKTKLKELTDELALFTSDRTAGQDEQSTIQQKLRSMEEELERYRAENDDLRIDIDRIRETSDENERIANQRQHEIVQLESQMEDVREDAARQVSRIKDRCEIVRKSMQNQIGDLERQLAQTKATAKSAEKDRDEIRQKMQAQIRNLNENFEDAQMRIRNLQGHVNFLKNSYVTPNESMLHEKERIKGDPCGCAAEY